MTLSLFTPQRPRPRWRLWQDVDLADYIEAGWHAVESLVTAMERDAARCGHPYAWRSPGWYDWADFYPHRDLGVTWVPAARLRLFVYAAELPRVPEHGVPSGIVDTCSPFDPVAVEDRPWGRCVLQSPHAIWRDELVTQLSGARGDAVEAWLRNLWARSLYHGARMLLDAPRGTFADDVDTSQLLLALESAGWIRRMRLEPTIEQELCAQHDTERASAWTYEPNYQNAEACTFVRRPLARCA